MDGWTHMVSIPLDTETCTHEQRISPPIESSPFSSPSEMFVSAQHIVPMVSLIHSSIVSMVSPIHSSIVSMVSSIHSSIVSKVSLIHSRIVSKVSLIHSSIMFMVPLIHSLIMSMVSHIHSSIVSMVSPIRSSIVCGVSDPFIHRVYSVSAHSSMGSILPSQSDMPLLILKNIVISCMSLPRRDRCFEMVVNVESYDYDGVHSVIVFMVSQIRSSIMSMVSQTIHRWAQILPSQSNVSLLMLKNVVIPGMSLSSRD